MTVTYYRQRPSPWFFATTIVGICALFVGIAFGAAGDDVKTPRPPDAITRADYVRTITSLQDRIDTLEANEQRRALVEQDQIHRELEQRASRSSAQPRPRILRAGGCARWRPLIAAHFPAYAVDKAVAVCNCESHGNPAARNPRSSAAGLFQILGPGPLDPEANVRQAAAMFRARQWAPWAACT